MTTPVAPPAPDTTPPSAPGTLTATAISASRVDLSWGAPPTTSGSPATTSSAARAPAAPASPRSRTATTTSYSDTTAAAGTSYSYRVRANDAALNLGPYSNTATATTPSPDTTPPSAPGTLTANAVSSSRVDLELGRGNRQRRRDRLPHRALPGRRLQQLRRDRHHRPPPATATPPPPPAPATATASAPTTPRPTSAPTPTPPPRPRRCPAGRRRWPPTRLMRGRGRRWRMRRGTATTARLRTRPGWRRASTAALSFNGTSSRVTIPDSASLHLSTAMTLEAWVNPATTTAAWRDVIYKGNDNYYLEGTSTTSGRPGARRHLRRHQRLRHRGAGREHLDAPGGHLRRDHVRLYVNGTQVSSLAATGAIASSTNPLSIGSDSHLGPVLQRPDRRRPRLQHRPHRQPRSRPT